MGEAWPRFKVQSQHGLRHDPHDRKSFLRHCVSGKHHYKLGSISQALLKTVTHEHRSGGDAALGGRDCMLNPAR